MPQMSRNDIIATISDAGQQRKTLWIRAFERDGSIEPREVEPYSFRPKGSTERFYFYCLRHLGTRNFLVNNIIEVQITDNSFNPRYEVEF